MKRILKFWINFLLAWWCRFYGCGCGMKWTRYLNHRSYNLFWYYITIYWTTHWNRIIKKKIQPIKHYILNFIMYLWKYRLFQKNGYTFVTVYSSKCVIVFLKQTLVVFTAKWIWDRSIISIIEPSFDIILFQDLWRFAQIWSFCYCLAPKLFRNNNKIFLSSYLGKSVQIFINTETMPCQMMLNYRNNRSVSWRLSCTWYVFWMRVKHSFII